MKEIKETVFDRLADDAVLQGYTGYTVTDKRVYRRNPPERITIDATTPAYITLAFMKPSPVDPITDVDSAQRLDMVVEIDVYTNSETLRDNIGERISALFRRYYFLTATYRVMFTQKEAEEDIEEIHAATTLVDSYRKYLRFRMGPVYEI